MVDACITSTPVYEQASTRVASAVTWSAVAGALPLPGLDLLVMGFVQARLIRDLCRLYGHKASGEVLRGAAAVILGVAVPAGISRLLFGSGVKAVPILGTLVGMAAMAALGASATYALGFVYVQHFESGGGPLSLEKVKARVKAQFLDDQTANAPQSAA